MNRKDLEIELFRVATGSVHCEKKCDGVRSSTDERIPSRHVLISGSEDKISCVMISLAPAGSARTGKIKSAVFYERVSALCDKLGLEGSFILTNLCKCERIKGKKLPPETMQACAENHLAKELGLVDKSVPIIALGNRVFNVVRNNFPERFVLNIPSPDRSQDFRKTIDNKRLLEFAKAQIAKGKLGALCLCPPCARKHLSDNDVPCVISLNR